MTWLAQSKYDRIPSTREEYAKVAGVNSRTLRRWQEVDGFKDEVLGMARQFLTEGLPEVYATILREASKGSFQHAKLALELTGELTQLGDEDRPINQRHVLKWIDVDPSR